MEIKIESTKKNQLKMIQFPNKKYNIIYADPPWTYRDKAHAGKRGVEYKYPTMTIEDIKNLPVQQIIGDDCILFLWVTWPLIQEGLDTLRSWGFEYKTIGFIWIKKNKKAGTNFWGMGNWTRSNSEPCLIGIKGKPQRINASVHSVIESPIQIHSRKPSKARENIVCLVGDLPRIELFARESNLGEWDVWGNEVM